jgi:hypothetical protein
MAMGHSIQRLRSGERWWLAEVGLRAFGLAVLALCALCALSLCRSVRRPPADHAPDAIEVALALGTVTGWSIGWAFLVEGPGLFRLVTVPSRHRRFDV